MKDAHWVWRLERVDQANELIECLNVLKVISEIEIPDLTKDPGVDIVIARTKLFQVKELAGKAVGK